MTRRHPQAAALLAALAGVLGCGEDAAAPVIGGSGGAAAAGGGPMGGGGMAGAGGVGDEGSSCADAVELSPRVNLAGGTYYEHHGVIETPGDRDYFRIAAEAGQWWMMATVTGAYGEPDRIDTVLTLYDDAGEVQLARNDDWDRPRGWYADSEIVHRYQHAGTTCLELAERTDVVGESPRGGPDYTYRLVLFPIDDEVYDDWNLDAEPNDDVSGAQFLSSTDHPQEVIHTRIAGALAPAGDVDVYRIPTQVSTRVAQLVFLATGPAGNGSSGRPGVVRVLRDDGSGVVVAQVDLQLDLGQRYVRTQTEPDQSYLLEVPRAAGISPGPNDFYMVRSFGQAEAFHEVEPNDQPSGFAGGTVLSHPTLPGLSHLLYAGALPAGDVDWFGVYNVVAGSTLRVVCESWRLGSGVRDATFALFGPASEGSSTPAATPLQEQTETETEGVYWTDEPQLSASLPPVVAPIGGSYFMRVTASQYDPTVASDLYDCEVRVTAP